MLRQGPQRVASQLAAAAREQSVGEAEISPRPHDSRRRWFPLRPPGGADVREWWMPAMHDDRGIVLDSAALQAWCEDVAAVREALDVGDDDVVHIRSRELFDVTLIRVACVALDVAFCADATASTLDIDVDWSSGVPTPRMTRTSSAPHDRITALRHLSAETAAYVMPTSGSTGVRKHAVVGRAGLRAVFSHLWDVLREDVPSGASWTVSHDPGFGFSLFEVLGAITFKGSLRVSPRQAISDDQSIFEDAGDRPTVYCCTPSELALLVADPALHSVPFPDVIVLSGEPLSRADLPAFFEHGGTASTTLINTYASVEASGQVTATRVRREDVARATAGWVGRPLPDVTVRILGVDRQGEDGLASPDGEIVLEGPTLGLGYVEADPLRRFAEGTERTLRTGDRGRFADDGSLVITGRTNDVRKVGGRWIDLASVEQRVRAHPNVEAVAAIASTFPGATEAQEGSSLGLLIACSGSPASVARFVRRTLVGELGVQQSIRIRCVDRIPLLPGGKRDLRSVRSLLSEEHGSASRQTSRARILATWRALLGDGLDIDAPIFELGVDSLGVVHAASRLSEVLGRRVEPIELLQLPTIREQADALGAGAEADVRGAATDRSHGASDAERSRAVRRTQRERNNHHGS